MIVDLNIYVDVSDFDRLKSVLDNSFDIKKLKVNVVIFGEKVLIKYSKIELIK